MQFEGRPRSIAEMEFIARMFPCEMCGDRRALELETGGAGAVWIVRGSCPRCRIERTFVFETDEDLFAVDQPDLELGDQEPSRIVGPYELMAEIDRLVPVIVTNPERLAAPAWNTNTDAVERVQTALRELRKFLRPDEAALSPETHRTAHGASDQRARPERYTRAWIEAEMVRWDAMAARIAGDAPRVFAADRMLSRTTPPRGALVSEAVAVHRVWLERGRRGEGRLDVVTWDADEADLENARLTAARLEGVWLRRSDLRSARLDEATLVDVDLRGSALDATSLSRTSMTGCILEDTRAVGSSFHAAHISGGSWARAALEHSRWTGAVVEGTSFRGACLSRARLDGARFMRCDFREVDLGGCDLSGATLIGCAFAGAYGQPSATDGWTVLEADFSDAADGSDLGDVEDLQVELAS